jgi:TrmH family RNA methyltransferase
VIGDQSRLYNEGLLTDAQRDRIELVLVQPRNPLNIGAAARAMANFGFTRLSVVAPFEAHWREARSAVGAPETLRAAIEHATLADALAQSTLAVGTGTLTHREPDQAVLLLQELPVRISEEIARGGRVALIFGSEKRGLSRADLSRCHALVEIPTDPRQPSMNLGQAVAVCLYELKRSCQVDVPLPRSTPGADSATIDRLASVIEETMTAAGYSPGNMREANRHDLRLILRRLSWAEKDAKRALGLFRRILWRLRNPSEN